MVLGTTSSCSGKVGEVCLRSLCIQLTIDICLHRIYIWCCNFIITDSQVNTTHRITTIGFITFCIVFQALLHVGIILNVALDQLFLILFLIFGHTVFPQNNRVHLSSSHSFWGFILVQFCMLFVLDSDWLLTVSILNCQMYINL